MRLQALYILDDNAYQMVYGADVRSRIAELAEVIGPQHRSAEILKASALLSRVQVLISGWGGPRLDSTFLEAAPRLEAVFYGAGSLSEIMTPAAWDRGIVVSSANAANAVPVAEYTLATILFSLKHGWHLARQTRKERTFPARDGAPGCWGTTVGLVSLGVIARTLLELLKPFDLHVVAYDPYVTEAEAQRLGVKLVSLPELFAVSDVVSIHTPLLPETTGLITGQMIGSMKRGASLINTARGPIIREEEMIEVASAREDLQFVLDVAEEEPPAADSALYTLPNIVLTPHIAGSVGEECKRMGRCMVEELERYVSGKPLSRRVTQDLAVRSTHGTVTLNVRGLKAKQARVARATVN
jgi:phosphoglycerate dehydrogenase-like enzyme